jgi:hypothetical protein
MKSKGKKLSQNFLSEIKFHKIGPFSPKTPPQWSHWNLMERRPFIGTESCQKS